MNNEPCAVTPAEPNTGFQIIIGDSQSGQQLPVPSTSMPLANASTGGLSYQSANETERAEMDKVISGIDLTNPETIVALGKEEREKLAQLADDILNSIQPSVKLAFAEALRGLIDAVRNNSLDEIKKRIHKSSIRDVGKAILERFTGHDPKIEASKEMISNFMTDISGTRKIISEMTDKLHDQQVALDRNFTHINELGFAITKTAQRMRIVRAATAEFIRRVDLGENPILRDLEVQAQKSGRSDDAEKLQTAQANWNLIRTVDGDLLASVSVYDMNIANLAFTKQANYQNRVQTATTLTTTISGWKTQLAIFAVVATENAAAQLLGVARQLTEKSVKQNVELFDTLVDSIAQRSAQGTYNLRQIMGAQSAMADKLSKVGETVEAQFTQLEGDKKALAASSVQFREHMQKVYSRGYPGAQTEPRQPAIPSEKPAIQGGQAPANV